MSSDHFVMSHEFLHDYAHLTDVQCIHCRSVDHYPLPQSATRVYRTLSELHHNDGSLIQSIMLSNIIISLLFVFPQALHSQ